VSGRVWNGGGGEDARGVSGYVPGRSGRIMTWNGGGGEDAFSVGYDPAFIASGGTTPFGERYDGGDSGDSGD
jgi:hypothetical protein